MTRNTIFAATALAILAIAPIASATSAVAQRQTYRIPNEPSPSTYSCSEELGHLRRVYAAELAPVQDPTQVWVTPICVGDTMFRTAGNAGALRGAIANSPVLMSALAASAFQPEDVVGVRMMGPGTVTLYVNPAHP